MGDTGREPSSSKWGQSPSVPILFNGSVLADCSIRSSSCGGVGVEVEAKSPTQEEWNFNTVHSGGLS